MWICLGCALAARQWERVWKRGANGAGREEPWQRTVGPRLVRAPSARQTDEAMTPPGRSVPDSGPNCARASVKLKSYSSRLTGIDRAAEPERRLMAAVFRVVDDHRGSAYRRAAGFGSPRNHRLRAAAAYVASNVAGGRSASRTSARRSVSIPVACGRAIRRAPVPRTVLVAAHEVPNAEGVMALEHTPQGELGDQQRTIS